MTKTTIEQVRNICKRVNEQLLKMDSPILYQIGGRYNYFGIDIIDSKDLKMKNTLTSGLTKENAYDILRGILQTLYYLTDWR